MTISKPLHLPRLLLVVLGLALGLAILELPALLGVLDYGRIIRFRPRDAFADTDRSDPELLHIHPPHSSFRGQARGGNFAANFRVPQSAMDFYQWDVRYDQNGFRNDSDLTSASIVVIGDSFVESTTTPTPQMLTSVLARLQGTVVANLGQYGYGPLEELAVLRRYGLPLRPRTVVWMFFEGNDLADVIRYRKETTAQSKPPSFWTVFWNRSFTRNALAQVHAQFRRAFRPSGVKRSGVFQAPDGRKTTLYFLYYPPGLTNEELNAFDRTVLTLSAAHDLCAAQGARLVFVFVPTKFRVFYDLCQFSAESDCRNWRASGLPERMQTAVKSISSDLGYLDLTPSLVDAAKRGVLSYYRDDDHWSPAGDGVAAAAINDYLASGHGR